MEALIPGTTSYNIEVKHLPIWSHLCLTYEMCCTIWCHLYSLKTVKNINGGKLHLVKLQPKACKVTLFHGCFHIFYIVQMIPNRVTHDFVLKIVESWKKSYNTF